MNKKEIAELAIMELEKIYPDIKCMLNYSKPYELMFAAILSAQCKDERVNIITETLFVKYPDLQSFADADLSELEQDIKSCGLYRAKAKSLKYTARKLIDDFGGEIPDTMEQLLTFTGIGRKIANLVMGDIFNKPAIVTDTHCIRISGRLGLTEHEQPYKVEKDLKQLIPPEISNHFCHQLVQFGRDICDAKKPKCNECTLNYFCKYYSEIHKKGD